MNSRYMVYMLVSPFKKIFFVTLIIYLKFFNFTEMKRLNEALKCQASQNVSVCSNLNGVKNENWQMCKCGLCNIPDPDLGARIIMRIHVTNDL